MSPFALTYGMEDIILTEIGMPTLRIGIPEEANAEAITKDLDMVKTGKPVQQAGKTVNLPRWRPSLEKSL